MGWDGVELQQGGKVGENFVCEAGHLPCLGDNNSTRLIVHQVTTPIDLRQTKMVKFYLSCSGI